MSKFTLAEIYIGLMTGTSGTLDIAAVNFLNDDITIIGEEISLFHSSKEEIKKITNSNNLVRSSVEN